MAHTPGRDRLCKTTRSGSALRRRRIRTSAAERAVANRDLHRVGVDDQVQHRGVGRQVSPGPDFQDPGGTLLLQLDRDVEGDPRVRETELDDRSFHRRLLVRRQLRLTSWLSPGCSTPSPSGNS